MADAGGWVRLGRGDVERSARALARLRAGADGPDAVGGALTAGAAVVGRAADASGWPEVVGVLWPDGALGWLVLGGAAARLDPPGVLPDALFETLETLAVARGHRTVHVRIASEGRQLAERLRRRGYEAGAIAPGRGDPGGAVCVLDLATWVAPARARCRWASADARLCAYHDVEWGVWVDDDRELFERLSLEVFQAGLSWRTVLAKRAALRGALLGFDPALLANADAGLRERFLADPAGIRSAAKFDACVHNARAVERIAAAEGSFARALRSRPPQTLGAWLAPHLKFFGPTVARSFFESVGLVPPPHDPGCSGGGAR